MAGGSKRGVGYVKVMWRVKMLPGGGDRGKVLSGEEEQNLGKEKNDVTG
jgi:hypothetical protein